MSVRDLLMAARVVNDPVLAVGHNNSPYVTAYPWSGGFGSPVANPATLPGNAANGVAFSPDGAFVAVGHSTSPYISVYPWSSSGFGTRVANPASALAGTGNAVAWRPQ